MKGQQATAPPPYPGEPISQPGYLPPQPGFAPPPQGGGSTVMVTPPVTVVHVQSSFGPHPIQMQCPRCSATVVTSTKTTAGLLTYLIAGGLCLLGCVFGCCLIPFCMDSCQNVEHFCPNCNNFLGTYNRL